MIGITKIAGTKTACGTSISPSEKACRAKHNLHILNLCPRRKTRVRSLCEIGRPKKKDFQIETRCNWYLLDLTQNSIYSQGYSVYMKALV